MANRLNDATCRKFDIPEGQLTIHANRGSAMTSEPVAMRRTEADFTVPTQSKIRFACDLASEVRANLRGRGQELVLG